VDIVEAELAQWRVEALEIAVEVLPAD
jgi:hypothetical protein